VPFQLPESIQTLLAALSRLPGIGPRSAERIALHLVQSDPNESRHLAQSLVQARDKIKTCNNCGALTEMVPCPLCSDPQRDSTLICVVERAVDILSIEKTGAFRGRFHVLGGKISPINGVNAEDLKIAELEQRFGREPIREVVLALPTDVEGDATSFYLAKRFAGRGIKVTRLAYGLPAGSGLEYTDELTLTRALEGRREL
jgi:recombination protein RecR